MNHVEQATSPLAFGSMLSRFDFVLVQRFQRCDGAGAPARSMIIPWKSGASAPRKAPSFQKSAASAAL